MPENPPVLDVRDVVVTLRRTEILRGLTLCAAAGEVTAVLGPNGAGKTTFIRCCNGLITPQHGTITVLGGPPGSPAARTGVGVMPQSTGAWSGIRADELLRYLASLYANPQPVEALLDELHLRPFARTPYRRLSGGQQQLVNLAGALIGRPRLIFLDEPTAGMDPHVRHHTWDLIRRLRDSGVAVLLTTHAMEEAEALADQVHIMDAGRVVVAGTVAELTAERSLDEVFRTSTTGAW